MPCPKVEATYDARCCRLIQRCRSRANSSGKRERQVPVTSCVHWEAAHQLVSSYRWGRINWCPKELVPKRGTWYEREGGNEAGVEVGLEVGLGVGLEMVLFGV